MRILIKYHLRLGDVIQCFPAARLLQRQGHEVWLECLPEYHSIFQCVDYVRPLAPGHGQKFSWVMDLQVWPDRYHDYRRSKKPFREYVYGRFPELAGAVWPIEFTRTDFDLSSYGLPERFALVAGCGYSQATKVPRPWLAGNVRRVADGLPEYWLRENLTVTDLSHLVALIRKAEVFVTINTSCTHMAEGLRDLYYHVVEQGFDFQDDLCAENQIRWSHLL